MLDIGDFEACSAWRDLEACSAWRLERDGQGNQVRYQHEYFQAA